MSPGWPAPSSCWLACLTGLCSPCPACSLAPGGRLPRSLCCRPAPHLCPVAVFGEEAAELRPSPCCIHLAFGRLAHSPPNSTPLLPLSAPGGQFSFSLGPQRPSWGRASNLLSPKVTKQEKDALVGRWRRQESSPVVAWGDGQRPPDCCQPPGP